MAVGALTLYSPPNLGPHEDLRIAIEHKEVIKLRKLLKEKGYNKELAQPDSSDFNFLLGRVCKSCFMDNVPTGR